VRGGQPGKDYPVLCRNFIPWRALAQGCPIVFNQLHLAIQVLAKELNWGAETGGVYGIIQAAADPFADCGNHCGVGCLNVF
jgi:hypothetical protein